MSKKRLKSENEGGGKMYLMAGLVSLVAVGYFVYQVPMMLTTTFTRLTCLLGLSGDKGKHSS